MTSPPSVDDMRDYFMAVREVIEKDVAPLRVPARRG
jgi:hypothetical protein